ncbi:hypothetical protein GQ53DRAFT_166641 [Thozetella sp. PMI_491]|nr:hypothetical protein GQ53DRAFT_166641 [Thozetella sp. PMI_491]
MRGGGRGLVGVWGGFFFFFCHGYLDSKEQNSAVRRGRRGCKRPQELQSHSRNSRRATRQCLVPLAGSITDSPGQSALPAELANEVAGSEGSEAPERATKVLCTARQHRR